MLEVNQFPNFQVELSFQTGDIIKVFGDMDDDGFFMGELNGVRGLVPSNFLTDAPPEYGGDGRGGRRGGGQPQQQHPQQHPPQHMGGGPQDHRRPPGPGARGPPPPPREGTQMMGGQGQGRGGGPRKGRLLDYDLMNQKSFLKNGKEIIKMK